MADLAVAVGVGLLALDLLGGRDQQLTITDNLTTNMMVNVTTNVVTDCFNSLAAVETIDITDSPSYISTFEKVSPDPYSQCLIKLSAVRNARQNLELEAEQRNSDYTPQWPNPLIDIMIATGLTPEISIPTNIPSTSAAPGTAPAILGACEAVVHPNLVRNISQRTVQSAVASCNVDTTINNNIQQNISGTISAQLQNQQDFIGQLEGNLSGRTESIANNLASSLGQNVTSNLVNSLRLRMAVQEKISIKGGSLLVENINQQFRGTQVGTLSMVNTVTNQIRQSATYSISQSLQNKNDTIGDLTKDYLQTINTMADLLEDLTTNLLIIVGLIIFAVIMVVGALFMFNKSFNAMFKSALGLTQMQLETKLAQQRTALLKQKNQ